MALLALPCFVFSQLKIEGQIGGANFVGHSLNTELDIRLSANGLHYLQPSIGLGLNYWNPGSVLATTKVGLHYRYANWSVGAEAAGFSLHPFWSTPFDRNDWIDLLVYPNIAYIFFPDIESKLYYKVSLGAYFAFSRYVTGPGFDYDLVWEGDVIPGFGLSMGYRF